MQFYDVISLFTCIYVSGKFSIHAELNNFAFENIRYDFA